MSDDFASPENEDRTPYITWDDVDRIEVPSRRTVEGRSFQVEQAHIDVWKDHPRGAWSLREVRADGSTQWVLSSFYQTRDNV